MCRFHSTFVDSIRRSSENLNLDGIKQLLWVWKKKPTLDQRSGDLVLMLVPALIQLCDPGRRQGLGASIFFFLNL